MKRVEFYHDKFTKLCKQLRWTTIALATECDVSRQCISLWKRGKIVPNEGKVRMLARVLKINVSEFSNLEDSIPVSKKDLSTVVGAWTALAKSNRISHFETRDKFVKQIYDHFYEYEQIYLLTKALFDSIHSILYVKDRSLKYAIANKAFLDNVPKKVPGDNICGRTDFDFFPDKEAEYNHQEDIEVFHSGRPVLNAERALIGSRNKKISLVSKYPIMDEQKQVVGILGNIIDITELRKMEFLQSIINEALGKLDITVSVRDVDKHRIIYYTGSAESVFGIDNSIQAGETSDYFLNNIVHPADREEQRKYWESGNIPPSREYRIIHPQKGLRIIKAITYPIEGKNDEKYSVALSIDVTSK